MAVSQRFERAKNELARLASQPPVDVRLSGVRESGGPFGWFEHKVTGEELNDVIRNLQSAFNDANVNIQNLYEASCLTFHIADALENDYMAKFQVSLNEALESGRKAQATAEALKKQQQVLAASVEALKRTSAKVNSMKAGGSSMGVAVFLSIIGVVAVLHLVLDIVGVL
ncbi:MAG: hypothetical protein MR215_00705 [Bacteroidales bacterium]|nr:hypothetical protein [Bacteroidales bacterium]